MKTKANGTAMGIPLVIAIGTIISLTISLTGAAVSAWLVMTEKIGEGGIHFAAMVVVALAATVGAWFSTSAIKRLRLQICLLSGVSYSLVLLGITALFFGGQYQGIGTMAIVILCSCAVIALVPTKNGRFKLKKKKSYR